MDSSSEFLSSKQQQQQQQQRRPDIMGAAASTLAKKNLETTTSKPELMSRDAIGGGGGVGGSGGGQLAMGPDGTPIRKQLSKSSAYLSNSAQSINEESMYLNSGNGGGAVATTSGPGAVSGGAGSGPVAMTSGSTTNPRYQQLSNPTLNRVVGGAAGASNTRPEKLFSASHLNQLKNSSNKNINKFLNGVIAAGGGGGGDYIDSDGSENSLLSQASKMSSQSGPPEFLKSKKQFNFMFSYYFFKRNKKTNQMD